MVGHTFPQEAIQKWIEYYNKLVDKEKAACVWMANPKVGDDIKMSEFLRYKCEVLNAVEEYGKFFRAIGITIQPGEKIVPGNGEGSDGGTSADV